MKKIKATEIVLFACLLISCFIVPRFITGQILSGIGEHYVVSKSELIGDRYFPRVEGINPTFPEGGWFEQVIRVGLIGLTVFYAFRVAKRLDRESLPDDKDKKRRWFPRVIWKAFVSGLARILSRRNIGWAVILMGVAIVAGMVINSWPRGSIPGDTTIGLDEFLGKTPLEPHTFTWPAVVYFLGRLLVSPLFYAGVVVVVVGIVILKGGKRR